MSRFAEQLARLSPRQRAMVELRLRQSAESPRQEIPRQPRENDEIPASFSQQRLWFLDQLGLGSQFNMTSVFQLRGWLNQAALERAVEMVVRRHEVLRTVFTERAGSPLQNVLSDLCIELPLIDLTALSPAGGDAAKEETLRLLAADERMPFDLLRGPLLRCRLVRWSAQDHVLILTLHHIICDWWSTRILMRDLALLYAGLFQSSVPLLPELPIQYADFAVWQRQLLQGSFLDAQLSYWRRHMAGAPSLAELPIDHPRLPSQDPRGACCSFLLPAEWTARLKELGRHAECTLFMVLLAAFQTLLRHCSTRDDVVVSAPISYRNWIEVEGLVGFFANTLLFRVGFGGDPAFAEILSRVRTAVLEAYAHQHVPFDQLVQELAPERNLSHNPVAQVGMSFIESLPEEIIQVPGLNVSSFSYESSATQFDLNLILIDTRSGLKGCLQYRPALFDRSTIERLVEQLRQILGLVAERPQIRLGELRKLLANAAEQRWRQIGQELEEASLHGLRRKGRTSLSRRGAE